MYIQRMGVLYKLYCLGWRSGSLSDMSPAHHRLLSIFLYYRKGYLAGAEWRQQQYQDS
jgi:hypothetical protein